MTPSQALILEALGRCTMGVGTSEKRFVRQMRFHVGDLSPKQASFLETITHRYRAQLEWRTVRDATHAQIMETIRKASAAVQARKDEAKIREASP
jgi:hypothetical protein